MFTLEDKKKLFKISFQYFCFSLFLFLFNLIYSIFAHGVSSAYMDYAFLIPFLGGSIVSLLFFKLPTPGEIVRQTWRMGLITLVIGCLLHGVFDIYGSEVSLVNVFFYTGFLLIFGSLSLYVIQTSARKH